MILLSIGIIIGTFIGYCTGAMMATGKRADESIERMSTRYANSKECAPINPPE